MEFSLAKRALPAGQRDRSASSFKSNRFDVPTEMAQGARLEYLFATNRGVLKIIAAAENNSSLALLGLRSNETVGGARSGIHPARGSLHAAQV